MHPIQRFIYERMFINKFQDMNDSFLYLQMIIHYSQCNLKHYVVAGIVDFISSWDEVLEKKWKALDGLGQSFVFM